MAKPIKRTYGWKPDLPDRRDYLYVHNKAVPILDKVDLRPGCSPVEDQGELGSCTGQAIAGAIEFNYIKQNKPQNISRLFIYYQERLMEGTVKQDAGAMIRDGIKACVQYGAPMESVWPYNISKFARKPSAAAYKDALNRQVVEYRRVVGFDDFLGALSAGFPVVFGFSVYESFESAQVAETGIMPMPAASERLLGGHAVCAVGYDKSKNWAIVRNSWGSSWGLGGYFYMPFGILQNANMSDDFWTITKMEIH